MASYPTVQLLHELPDRSRHIDWMIAADPGGTGPLVTFRVGTRVDELPPGGRLDARRIADHRPAYLTYEGPVSGDRGSVRRVARGRVLAWDRGGDRWSMDIAWDDPRPGGTGRRQRLSVIRAGAGDLWAIEAAGVVAGDRDV